MAWFLKLASGLMCCPHYVWQGANVYSMRVHRPFIFIASLALAAWALLMGVLVLIYGLNAGSTRCGKLCGLGFAIRQYFGWHAYEVGVAMLCFGVAAVCVSIALRDSLHSGLRGKRRRRGVRQRRR